MNENKPVDALPNMGSLAKKNPYIPTVPPYPHRKFGALSSSEDAGKLADTVKGIIIGCGTLIIYIAHALGVGIGPDELQLFAVNAGIAVSSLWTAYGLVKKLFIWVQTKWANRIHG